jgi:glucose/arabinose dehydrogenase
VVALLAAAALVLAGCGSTPASSLVSIGAGLQGVDGLHATVYARGIPQMAAFALDSRRRLWVARSGSSQHAQDGVYLVARARAKPARIVSSIRGPLGLVWVGSSLYVSSLDGVERFSGFTGTAFRQRRFVLRGPVTGAENNNLVLAPNGRLVLAVSAPCDHCTTSPRYSASIISSNTDGSDVRVVASGIRAAYGLVYRGGTLYTSLNQRDDLGAKTPGDWVAAIRNGQDWGFPQCYGQGGPACNGVPSPLGVLDPHAAGGGVAVYGGGVLAAEWVYGKVLRVGLDGGTATPYLTGLSHPLPLLTAPGGSLLVGDWGTGVVYRVAGLIATITPRR